MKTFIIIKKNIISLIKNLVSILFVLYIIFLIIFINTNFSAAKNGLILFANNVLPSLFPFFIAAELLQYTNLVFYLSKKFNKLMKPLFNLPGSAVYPFIIGMISGYPVGAQIVCNLYKENICSKEESERMLPLCNNSGLLFVIATVGISFYNSSTIGFVLFTIHIISAIIVGIITGFFSKNNYTEINNYSFKRQPYIKFSNLGNILKQSIKNSIKNVLIVGGFITFFSVVISIITNTKILYPTNFILSKIFNINYNIINAVSIGIIEFTHGLNLLSHVFDKNITLIFSLSSLLIGFGGLSVFLQVMGISSNYNLSIKKYLLGKSLQGIIAFFITYLLFSIPFFNLNL